LESEEREIRRPQPPSDIYRDVSDRGLMELLASTSYKTMRAVDRLINMLGESQKTIANDLSDVADSVGTVADLIDELEIPSFLKSKKSK
jgi:hypothetical protein